MTNDTDFQTEHNQNLTQIQKYKRKCGSEAIQSGIVCLVSSIGTLITANKCDERITIILVAISLVCGLSCIMNSCGWHKMKTAEKQLNQVISAHNTISSKYNEMTSELERIQKQNKPDNIKAQELEAALQKYEDFFNNFDKTIKSKKR